MKLLGIFIVCFAFIMLTGIKSSQAQENFQQLTDVYQEGLEDGIITDNYVLSRSKRGTCDIHVSLCVAHCRVKGYKRAYCSSRKICTCRN